MDVMRQFLRQYARRVASCIHAWAMRAFVATRCRRGFGDAVDAVVEDEVPKDYPRMDYLLMRRTLWDVLNFAFDSMLQLMVSFLVPHGGPK